MNNQPNKVIRFPSASKGRQGKAVRNIDSVKYFTQPQVQALRKVARNGAGGGTLSAVRGWMLVDLFTSSGLRVSEVSDLRCSDIRTGYGESEILVRDGKGGKSRTVQIPESLKLHLKKFLTWKESRREPVGKDDPVFLGQRGKMSSQAIQQIVKKYLKLLDLYRPGMSCHALRHSYGFDYYRRNKDLRGLQMQLGHSSVATTEIYSDVSKSDIQDRIKGLWGKC